MNNQENTEYSVTTKLKELNEQVACLQILGLMAGWLLTEKNEREEADEYVNYYGDFFIETDEESALFDEFVRKVDDCVNKKIDSLNKAKVEIQLMGIQSYRDGITRKNMFSCVSTLLHLYVAEEEIEDFLIKLRELKEKKIDKIVNEIESGSEHE